jgi:AraC family ethanolamine operon transcriptional activator
MEPMPTAHARPSPLATITAPRSEALCDAAGPAVLRLHTHDIDEQAERLQHWDQSYVQLSPGRFEGRLIETWLGDIHCFRESTNQVIHERGCSRPGTRTFCVPLAMDGRASFRGTDWPRDACATLGGGVEFDLRTPARLDVIAVSFRADRLAEMAGEHGVDPARLERWLSSSCTARLPGEAVDALRRMLLEVAMLVEGRSTLLRHPGVCASIEAALYEAFLRVMAETVELGRPPASYPSRRQLVNRAIDLVAAHPDTLLTVGDLCRLLQVSRRTLQMHFEEVLQISPLQYLRAFRLSRVRALLHAQGGQLRVQDAAARWGFWHLSQFARDYKRLFGELPSETAVTARRREAAAAAPLPWTPWQEPLAEG